VLSRNNQGSANFTADSATSGWIGVTDTQSQPTGVSTFSNVFNLASPQSGVLAGLWWLGSYGNATAGAALDLNGNQISSMGENCGSNGALFYVDDRNGWFNAGSNTLSITLSDPNSEQDAVRLQLLNTLTIDPTVTIDGTGTVTDNYSGEGQELIDNQGTIDADVSGQTLTVDPYAFVNDGTAEATNGGILTIGNSSTNWVNEADGTISAVDSTLNLEGSYANFGTITVTDSAVNLYGFFTLGTLGNFVRQADAGGNGSITLFRTLDLAGNTIDTTQGLWQNLFVNGGTIENGTIIDGPTGTLGFANHGNNTLSDVTVDGGLAVTSADSAGCAFVRLDNGTQILDAAGQNPGNVTMATAASVRPSISSATPISSTT
jgi:hypothetical protein